MADDPDFPGLKIPKGKPASQTKPTVVPKAQGTGGAPTPAPTDPDFPGLKIPTAKPGGGSVAAAPPTNDEGSFWSLMGPGWDPSKSQPADLSQPQTWTDWGTRTYSPSVSDLGRAALDDVSFGTGDWARSKMTGENLADLRARTADAQAALGPMGPIVNAGTYMAGPGMLASKGVTKLAGTVGRYGAAAVEGGATSALSSAGHQAGADQFDIDKVLEDTAKGMAFGVAAQGVGDITSPAIQRVGDYVTRRPGVAGEEWNWRQRAGMDDPTLPGDVADVKARLPPNDPAHPALAKLQGALAQSTQPGRVADVASAGVGYGVNYVLGGGDNAAANWLSAGGPALYSRFAGNPAARAINTYDRSLNVGHALDELYSMYSPSGKPATTPVGGWADSLRELTVGGQRPNEGNAQWW